MQEIIRAKAPVRIGIGGGGTDVDPYASEHGGYVFNTTIDKYSYCTLVPRNDHMMQVTSEYYGRYSAELNNRPLPIDGDMKLINAVANHFHIKNGFEISIRSDVPTGSGLGGSSSMIVSMIGAVANWLDLDMSRAEIASLACHLERDVIGLEGGKQDQYAATYGGFNSFRFSKDGVTVLPAKISQDYIYELQCRSVMCFTGMTHDSAAIQNLAVDNMKKGQNIEALDRTKELALRMRAALRHGEIDTLGALLNEAWEEKKKISNAVSNSQIDDLYNTAIQKGAVGGKVSGAGGGGFMFFITDYDKKGKVAEALKKKGAIVTDFGFENNGVTSWRSTI